MAPKKKTSPQALAEGTIQSLITATGRYEGAITTASALAVAFAALYFHVDAWAVGTITIVALFLYQARTIWVRRLDNDALEAHFDRNRPSEPSEPVRKVIKGISKPKKEKEK